MLRVIMDVNAILIFKLIPTILQQEEEQPEEIDMYIFYKLEN